MATLPTFVAQFITRTDYTSTSVEFFSIVNTKTQDIIIGDSIDELLGSIIQNHITNLYIHDFNYMASYIIDYILKNNFTYNPNGRFDFIGDFGYNLFRDDVGHVYYIKLFFKTINGRQSCEFRSSKNKTMSSIASMYKSFGINIDTDIDISNISDSTIQLGACDKLTDQLMEQAIISAKIVASVIKELKKVGYSKLTIGSDAVKQWLKLDGDQTGDLVRLDTDIDKDLRFAYRGGFTWINPKYENKVINDGVVLDVNSLYPYVMRYCRLPYGYPTWTTEKPSEDSYYIAHVCVTASLKNNHIPCISNMFHSDPGAASIVSNEYLDELVSADVWLTNYDLDLLYSNYDIDSIKYYGAYVFKTREGMFNNFIDYHYEIKRNSTGAKRQLSKLMLDSLYGRFGIKINKKTSLPIMYNGKIKYIEGRELEDRTVRYLPIAIFITSIARYLIINEGLSVIDRLVYIDTDSLHLIGTDIPKDFNISDKLGDYKIESKFIKAKYVGLKTYIHDDITEQGIKTSITMAGAPDTVKKNINWDNFKYGTVVPGKYFIRTLPGGCIRCLTTFKITSV